jgi:hypothetical protein
MQKLSVSFQETLIEICLSEDTQRILLIPSPLGCDCRCQTGQVQTFSCHFHSAIDPVLGFTNQHLKRSMAFLSISPLNLSEPLYNRS